jgi:hypothetical protein
MAISEKTTDRLEPLITGRRGTNNLQITAENAYMITGCSTNPRIGLYVSGQCR